MPRSDALSCNLFHLCSLALILCTTSNVSPFLLLRLVQSGSYSGGLCPVRAKDHRLRVGHVDHRQRAEVSLGFCFSP